MGISERNPLDTGTAIEATEHVPSHSPKQDIRDGRTAKPRLHGYIPDHRIVSDIRCIQQLLLKQSGTVLAAHRRVVQPVRVMFGLIN